MEYIFYILIAIIVAAIVSQVRLFYQNNNKNVRTFIEDSLGWIMVIYGLILAFSISIFYDRYISVRDTFVSEVTNLQIITIYFKQMPDSKERNEVIESIKNYTQGVIKYLPGDLQKRRYSPILDDLYFQMNGRIIKYVQKHPENPFDNNILKRMTTNMKIKQLIEEINAGSYYIYILAFLSIFILIPLSLTTIHNRVVQLIIDICILIILFTGIYLCTILNNPFVQSPIAINLSMYEVLLKEINL